jgi:hypothetical protein
LQDHPSTAVTIEIFCHRRAGHLGRLPLRHHVSLAYQASTWMRDVTDRLVGHAGTAVRRFGLGNNLKWRRERELPVPAMVSASGTLFMGSHVRVDASAAGQISLAFTSTTRPRRPP